MNNGAETSPVIVLAPTGVAAFNIHGTMIHSTLSILINSSDLSIEGERLKNLQKKLNGVNYVIIDEKSILDHRMLFVVDSHLRAAFPEHRNQPFGGRSVILVGDFGQLLLVIDEPIYSKKPRHDSLSNDGMNVYNQFREVYWLDAVCHQSGNSPEQRLFRDILMRLRDGESTIDNWRILATRFDNSSTTENNQFMDAIHITSRKVDVHEINLAKLKSLNAPIARVRAVHTGGNDASKADSDTAKGLEAQLLLSKGVRVMLRANLSVETGLVNGSVGTIDDILFQENQGPPSLPIAVLVEFDNYNGPAIISTKGNKVVPITPIRRFWETKTVACSRLQIPLTFAQGLTLPKAFIDIGKKEYFAGFTFVAISRVSALKDILFKPFSFEKIHQIRSCDRVKERKKEEKQLLDNYIIL
ncbi:ATP-dependent DNA helicase PIF1-like [Rhizophagus irregularis DAOM 181602=DAOM 197198]|nr:ATP-dependent DNA helicase PIF1-like [Rhizophagus irregularis DAOM 181602=DAOM 197198]